MGARAEQRHVFSTDLQTIESEIREYSGKIVQADKSAGTAILEIGRRLRFVKEHNLAHGEWTSWLGRVCIEPRTAQRYMKAYEQFGDATLASCLTASKIFELLSLPPEINRTTFAATKHTIPSTGEKKTIATMSKAEIREIVRVERERAGLIKPKEPTQETKEETPRQHTGNPFDNIALDPEQREILYGLPVSLALKIVELEAEVMTAVLNVAAELSIHILTEYYDEILSDARSGKKMSDIIRPYKRPADKQPLSNLYINPYEILGVWIGDNDAAVKRKYRELARKVHPDTGGSELLFKIVNAAWEKYQRDY